MNKENVVRNINKIGKAGTVISTIIQVFLIIGLAGVIIGAAVLLSGISENVIESALTGGKNMLFSVDLSTVLVILLIFALTYIFKYGAQLQTESDETL